MCEREREKKTVNKKIPRERERVRERVLENGIFFTLLHGGLISVHLCTQMCLFEYGCVCVFVCVFECVFVCFCVLCV